MTARARAFSAAVLAAILNVGCATNLSPLSPRTAATPLIVQIDVGTSTNAYVVMGARPILVDTGWGASTEKLERAFSALKIDPKQLSLIVLTHGHGDHAGGARRMRELSGAKVVVGHGDEDMLAAGRDRTLFPMGFLGRLLRRSSDKPFPPFAPDLIVSAPVDLNPYGVDGTIVPMPGHTPGSVAVVLKTGEAIVGDMLRGELLSAHTPARHFFHEDCAAAEAHIGPLVDAGSARLYVGHGGPIEGKAARVAFVHDPCPPAEHP